MLMLQNAYSLTNAVHLPIYYHLPQTLYPIKHFNNKNETVGKLAVEFYQNSNLFKNIFLGTMSEVSIQLKKLIKLISIENYKKKIGTISKVSIQEA